VFDTSKDKEYFGDLIQSITRFAICYCAGYSNSQKTGTVILLQQYVANTKWLSGVVIRAPDLRSTDRRFDSRPRHCQATTLGKLFTPMCLCSPSSISWYLARAFMSTRLYVAAIHGSSEQGEYCSKQFSSDCRLEPLYKFSTLLYFHFTKNKAAWCSGNMSVLINVVSLHRAQLLLGWVTVCWQINRLCM